MKWQSWVLGIVASLIVSGIGAVVTLSLKSAAAQATAEQRVHVVERNQDAHAAKLEAILPLLERIDERTLDTIRRLERVETKVDEAPRRRGK